MLRAVRMLLVGLNILNWICVAAFALVTALLIAGPGIEARVALTFAEDAALLIRYAIIILLVGIAVGLAAHLIFRRLIAIIDTVAAGAPFSAANADRLRIIAWALLAIQLLDLGFGYAAMRVSAETGEYFGWSLGMSGWLAVLLLFVLARVFRQGAAMQDELAATV